jgi:hypothetical protein
VVLTIWVFKMLLRKFFSEPKPTFEEEKARFANELRMANAATRKTLFTESDQTFATFIEQYWQSDSRKSVEDSLDAINKLREAARDYPRVSMFFLNGHWIDVQNTADPRNFLNFLFILSAIKDKSYYEQNLYDVVTRTLAGKLQGDALEKLRILYQGSLNEETPWTFVVATVCASIFAYVLSKNDIAKELEIYLRQIIANKDQSLEKRFEKLLTISTKLQKGFIEEKLKSLHKENISSNNFEDARAYTELLCQLDKNRFLNLSGFINLLEQYTEPLDNKKSTLLICFEEKVKALKSNLQTFYQTPDLQEDFDFCDDVPEVDMTEKINNLYSIMQSAVDVFDLIMTKPECEKEFSCFESLVAGLSTLENDQYFVENLNRELSKLVATQPLRAQNTKRLA